MSHEVFEYFFEPEELEPLYSQLPVTAARARVVSASESANKEVVKEQREIPAWDVSR